MSPPYDGGGHQPEENVRFRIFVYLVSKVMESLPDDLILIIFSYFEPESLILGPSGVNKRFQNLSRRDSLWKPFLEPHTDYYTLFVRKNHIREMLYQMKVSPIRNQNFGFSVQRPRFSLEILERH